MNHKNLVLDSHSFCPNCGSARPLAPTGDGGIAAGHASGGQSMLPRADARAHIGNSEKAQREVNVAHIGNSEMSQRETNLANSSASKRYSGIVKSYSNQSGW